MSLIYLGKIPLNPITTKMGEKDIEFHIGESSVPNGYTQLEWIQNTANSNSWIDTGIMPSSDMLFETKLDFDISKLSDNFFCSLRQDNGNTRYYLLNLNSTYSFAVCNTTWPGVNIYKTAVTSPYEIKSHIEQTKLTLQVNNVIKSGSSNLVTLPTRTIPLFTGITSVSSGGTFNRLPYPVKCYYARFIDKGELVRNFIPCRRDLDNKVGMYDTISEMFFSSSGTDNFIAGNPIKLNTEAED